MHYQTSIVFVISSLNYSKTYKSMLIWKKSTLRRELEIHEWKIRLNLQPNLIKQGTI